MNSVIISSICAFFTGCWGLFRKSGIYALIDRIYTAFSYWWKDSCIMNFVKKDTGIRFGSSILYRIVRLPFAAAEAVGRVLGGRLDKQIELSIILNLVRDYMNNILALNTRFLGVMLVFGAAVNIVTELSSAAIAVGVIGILLAAVNYNITDFLQESRLVGFCQSAVGFKGIDWKFYRSEAVAKTHTLILAALSGCVSGVLVSVSPIIASALPIGVAGMSVILCYPIVGVFAAVAAAPFVPTMILAGLCFLTFGAQLIKSLIEKDFKWRVDGIGTGLGLFLIFMLAASLFSFNVLKSVMVWGMYLIFVGFYFVIINTIKTKEQLYNLLKVFAVLGFLVSLYGILQYVFGWTTANAWIDEQMFEEATMRVYSTMENPNVLGEYLLLLIPVSAVFMLKKESEWLERCVYGGIFLTSALCMILTQSRGCWLGLILAVMIFVTFYNGKLWGLLPVVLLALPFIMPEAMIDRMMSVGNLEDSSTSYRVFIWRGSFEMLRDFWLGGIGMGEGAFRNVYPLYSFNGIVAPHSHNTYLQLWVEAGIIAPIIFVIIMAVLIKKLWHSYKNFGKGTSDSLVPLAIGSGVIGFLLQSMFDYTFYNYRMMAMFFMIVAIGSAFSHISKGAEI